MSADFTYKVIMIGDSTVGKTSLTHRYITGVFVDSPRLTIGVDFYSKIIRLGNGQKVRLQIWDFGGEERFRFLLPSYSKGSNATIFLYDITSKSSLENSRIWLEIVRKNAGNIPVFLIGSKVDLEEHREVAFSEAEEMASELLCQPPLELSSKTGENVEESFKLITDLLLDESKRFMDVE